MSDHLILSFEPFAAGAPGAIRHWAEMGPILAVHVDVRANRGIPSVTGGFVICDRLTLIDIEFETQGHCIRGGCI